MIITMSSESLFRLILPNFLSEFLRSFPPTSKEGYSRWGGVSKPRWRSSWLWKKMMRIWMNRISQYELLKPPLFWIKILCYNNWTWELRLHWVLRLMKYFCSSTRGQPNLETFRKFAEYGPPCRPYCRQWRTASIEIGLAFVDKAFVFLRQCLAMERVR